MQAARAEAVARFLGDDLPGALAPGGAGVERDPRMREVLEHASRQIDSRFSDDPATRGDVHSVLGQTWQALGDRDRDRGVQHMEQAARHYAEAFGNADELTLRTRYRLVRNLSYANAAKQPATSASRSATAAPRGRHRIHQPRRKRTVRALRQGQRRRAKLPLRAGADAGGRWPQRGSDGRARRARPRCTDRQRLGARPGASAQRAAPPDPDAVGRSGSRTQAARRDAAALAALGTEDAADLERLQALPVASGHGAAD